MTMTATSGFLWQGGKRGTCSLEDLHEAGVPVREHPSGPGDHALLLFDAAKAAHVQINPGDYIVPTADGLGWLRREAGYAEEIDTGPDPLPGLYGLHLTRVGYRRWDAYSGAWHFRQDGLSVAEMNGEGWQPLYTAEGVTRGD